MKPIDLAFVAGTGPDASGTGALVAGLLAEAAREPSTRFVHRAMHGRGGLGVLRDRWDRLAFAWRARRMAAMAEQVVLLHPQTIGFPTFQAVVESRPHVWMYVLDAFVFCARSYNCLPGESSPCLRCLGNDGAAAVRHGCVDWFRSGPFHAHLPGWVRSGRLRLLAQCDSQARLLRAHFGPAATIRVVPLSVPDVEVPTSASARPTRARPLAVFHGTCYPAKGVARVVSLAHRLPEWDFLVPSAAEDFVRHFGPTEGLPPNLIFRRQSWDSGLAESVAAADLVLCPSNWSAPIEGAVLKSLATNGLVGLFPHETSFASEVPAEARLDVNPEDWPGTVSRLRAAVADPSVSAAIRAAARAFVARHLSVSRGMLAKVKAACAAGQASAE